MEAFVDKLDQNEDNIEIKNIMLSSCVNLFLKRPPEMYSALGKIMNKFINNEDEDMDLRDRAIFYCKAFQDIGKLKQTL